MVGLYPIYDPKNGLDMGDERLRATACPGVRTNNPDGSFDVDYDIPLAFYDCRLDDGVTLHQDVHDGLGEYPAARNPRKHPEWWGKTFYRHFPNHGFVGDIFTVNGDGLPDARGEAAQVPLPLPRRLRRPDLRVRADELDAGPEVRGVARPHRATSSQGQYRIPDGQQCMRFTQIATDGGLIPFPFERDTFELWPAKRREFIVDFTPYQDGTPTTKGDVIYLTNVMKMPDGRMWLNSSRSLPDPTYKVPVLKFVIGDYGPRQQPDPDAAARPPAAPRQLEEPARQPDDLRGQARAASGGEIEWLINGKPFDPAVVARSLPNPAGKRPLAQQKIGQLQPLGDPQRRRRDGCTPSTCTWRSTAPSCATAGS